MSDVQLSSMWEVTIENFDVIASVHGSSSLQPLLISRVGTISPYLSLYVAVSVFFKVHYLSYLSYLGYLSSVPKPAQRTFTCEPHMNSARVSCKPNHRD